MAKIEIVNYEEIPGKVGRMRSSAEKINSQLVDSYSKINAMKSNWHGKRYNELAKECNIIIPDINKLLKLVVTEIPYALEQVANNYSMADRRSKITGEQQTPSKKIPEVTSSTEATMKFITAEVTSVKTEISRAFALTVSSLNEYESTFNSINWESEAASRFKQEFTSLKRKVNDALNNIEKLFTTLIVQATEDIQSAESSNTI